MSRCEICETPLPSRDEREHRQGRPRRYCGLACKDEGRWIREARANAARTAARGFPQSVPAVEERIAARLAKLRASASQALGHPN
jgi:hypothetical protein